MLSKISRSLIERNTLMVEKFADTCHQVLVGALRKNQKSLAASSVHKIHGILEILHAADGSNDHRWLDLSILRTLGE